MTTQQFLLALALTVVLFVVGVVLLLPKRRPPLPPYRRIVTRTDDGEDAEIIQMECGHSYRIIHRRRGSMPCNQCQHPSEKSENQ